MLVALSQPWGMTDLLQWGFILSSVEGRTLMFAERTF
jgi:hypothetical protein